MPGADNFLIEPSAEIGSGGAHAVCEEHAAHRDPPLTDACARLDQRSKGARTEAAPCITGGSIAWEVADLGSSR